MTNAEKIIIAAAIDAVIGDAIKDAIKEEERQEREELEVREESFQDGEFQIKDEISIFLSFIFFN